jgi:hypothetical protein
MANIRHFITTFKYLYENIQMKKFIRQKLRESLSWFDEPTNESPLANELEMLLQLNLGARELQMALNKIEDKYTSEYAEYDGDTYGVIDAIKKHIPNKLAPLYDEMHPNVRYENVNEGGEPELRFNDGKFNKEGSNVIYMNGNPIVDFGVGGIGEITINGETYPNSIYLRGGYNASEQGKGYGTIGLRFIFQKLPKIQNIIIQCFDTACPFWTKMGGQEIAVKEMPGGHPLRTLRISRDSFE